MKSQLEWYQSVGADPDWLCFDGMGSINLFLATPQEKGSSAPVFGGVNVLCDIGHTKTTLAVLEGGNLSLFRTFGWGSLRSPSFWRKPGLKHLRMRKKPNIKK